MIVAVFIIGMIRENCAFLIFELFYFRKHFFMSPTTTHTSDDLLGLTEPKEGYTHICS